MKNELQDKLYDKYPSLFIERFEDMSRTSMCFGISTSDGWYKLIDDLCAELMNLKNSKLIRFAQIKEKFGTLRIHIDVMYPEEGVKSKNFFIRNFCLLKRFFFKYHMVDNCNNVLTIAQNIIRNYEAQSKFICEECGERGSWTDLEGWLTTLCLDCKTNKERFINR